MSRTSLTEARDRFSRRLKAIRVPKGFRTARAFAQALDIDENRYTRYERGEVEPSLDLLLRICELLGATPNDLLCDYIGSPAVSQVGGAPPGFAEDRPHDALFGGYPMGSSHTPLRDQPSARETAARSDATAWLLATELAAVQTRIETSLEEVSPFRRLELTSEIFSQLKSGPFAVFAGLAAQMRNSEADMETQTRIYKLVDEMVKELRVVSPEPAL